MREWGLTDVVDRGRQERLFCRCHHIHPRTAAQTNLSSCSYLYRGNQITHFNWHCKINSVLQDPTYVYIWETKIDSHFQPFPLLSRSTDSPEWQKRLWGRGRQTDTQSHMRVYNSSLPLVTPSFILFGLPISGHAGKRRKERGRAEFGYALCCVCFIH